jgi:AcrR family transcriptional regulator
MPCINDGAFAMRHTNDTKGRTRQRIIEAALKKFRAKAIDATAMAEVMAA